MFKQIDVHNTDSNYNNSTAHKPEKSLELGVCNKPFTHFRLEGGSKLAHHSDMEKVVILSSN